MSQEAMKLALEALRSDDYFIHVNAIKALEEALAKQEQEKNKKKWEDFDLSIHSRLSGSNS